jgi:hypothetical protein
MLSENPYAPSQVEEFSPRRQWDSLAKKQFYLLIVVVALHSVSFFSPIIQYEQPLLPLDNDGYSQSSWRAYHAHQKFLIYLKFIPLVMIGMLRFRNRKNYSVLTFVSCLITAWIIAHGIKAEDHLGRVTFSYYFELASIVLLTFATAYSRSWIIHRYPHGRKYTALKTTEDSTLESKS